MSEWDDIIEDRIQEAMEAGAFDDLPGKGKPLNLDDNPHEDSAAWTAHHLLRTSGYSLPWIEERREIEADVEAARARLARAHSWVRGGLTRNPPDSRSQARWREAIDAFQEQATALNRRIRDHNLKVPNAAFQYAPLNVEGEIKRLTAE
jgi:DnaJ family protein C protein 28